MVKEYYGTKTIFTAKVKLGLIIAGLIIIFLCGQKISIYGAGRWSKNIGIEYFINIHAKLLSKVGGSLIIISTIIAFLVYENFKLMKRVKALEEQLKCTIKDNNAG